MCHVELSRNAEISPLRSALSACDDVKADLTADISAIRSTIAGPLRRKTQRFEQSSMVTRLACSARTLS